MIWFDRLREEYLLMEWKPQNGWRYWRTTFRSSWLFDCAQKSCSVQFWTTPNWITSNYTNLHRVWIRVKIFQGHFTRYFLTYIFLLIQKVLDHQLAQVKWYVLPSLYIRSNWFQFIHILIEHNFIFVRLLVYVGVI